jgi:hypothetical protein
VPKSRNEDEFPGAGASAALAAPRHGSGKSANDAGMMPLLLLEISHKYSSKSSHK